MLEMMSSHYWPFVVLVISMALIIVQITVLRIHPFLALFIAAITAGLLAVKLDEKGATQEEPPGSSC